MSEVQIKVPTLSNDEIVQTAQNAASHAKELFLRALPEEAANMAKRAAHLVRDIDTEAHSKLKALEAKFRSHVPTAAAPAPASDPQT